MPVACLRVTLWWWKNAGNHNATTSGGLSLPWGIINSGFPDVVVLIPSISHYYHIVQGSESCHLATYRSQRFCTFKNLDFPFIAVKYCSVLSIQVLSIMHVRTREEKIYYYYIQTKLDLFDNNITYISDFKSSISRGKSNLKKWIHSIVCGYISRKFGEKMIKNVLSLWLVSFYWVHLLAALILFNLWIRLQPKITKIVILILK